MAKGNAQAFLDHMRKLKEKGMLNGTNGTVKEVQAVAQDSFDKMEAKREEVIRLLKQHPEMTEERFERCMIYLNDLIDKYQ